jgi:hypothetical protein
MRDRLKAWVVPPPLSADPVETLRWTRRMELASGVLAIVIGVVSWSEGWWHWALIGTGLLGLSPWPGPAAILRRARTNPDVLIRDPERRRARGRRAGAIVAAVEVVVMSTVGYVAFGWSGAAVFAALSLASGALALWVLMRRDVE